MLRIFVALLRIFRHLCDVLVHVREIRRLFLRRLDRRRLDIFAEQGKSFRLRIHVLHELLRRSKRFLVLRRIHLDAPAELIEFHRKRRARLRLDRSAQLPQFLKDRPQRPARRKILPVNLAKRNRGVQALLHLLRLQAVFSLDDAPLLIPDKERHQHAENRCEERSFHAGQKLGDRRSERLAIRIKEKQPLRDADKCKQHADGHRHLRTIVHIALVRMRHGTKTYHQFKNHTQTHANKESRGIQPYRAQRYIHSDPSKK